MTLSIGLSAGISVAGGIQVGDELTAAELKAVDYDGTNDYSARATDMVGNVDGPLGILSAWFRLDGGDGLNRYLYGSNGSLVRIKFNASDDTLQLLLPVTGGFSLVSTTIFTASATWRHILASWDVGTPANSRMYLDDVDEVVTPSGSPSGNINYTNTNHIVCAALITGTANFHGCLTEFYLNFKEFLDLTDVANRRKFISASGLPVFLGADGSGPTGTAPLIYYRNGVPFNLGTGGAFDVFGALEACSDTPLG